MANPNLASELNVIYGDTTGGAVLTSGFDVLTNSTTDSIYKINSLVISNLITSNDSVTVQIDNFFICKDVTVPPTGAIVVIDKNSSFYLKESSYVKCTSTLSDLSLYSIISYEILAKV